MTPIVSIIIPMSKGREKELARLMASIEAQTFKDHETIVVDRNEERNVQRAWGVTQAKGKYLMFLDSDMELSKYLLQDCVDKCERDCRDALVIPECAGGTGFWADCQCLEKRCYLYDKNMEAANRFVWRGAYRRVGGYRDDLVGPEDFDLHDRLVKDGAMLGRSTYFITHYEGGFWQTVKKKFYYGTKMGGFLVERPESFIPRFGSPIKPCFFQNWRLLAKSPLHAAGLIVMKLTQWLAGGCGLCCTIIKHLWLGRLKRKKI